MPYLLENENIRLQLDLPGENYGRSRFDWTGKITELTYKGIPLTGVEIEDRSQDPGIGRGFYNEFGINAPVDYDQAVTGGWFHKIGIGLLRKEEGPYDFFKDYEIQLADFHGEQKADRVLLECVSPLNNGISYRLKKEVHLLNSGFEILYRLENTGNTALRTNEYCHNFLAVDNDPIGENYVLRLPFVLDSDQFDAIVNPEKLVQVGEREFRFSGKPLEQFFYGNLTGGQSRRAQWALEHKESGIGLTEELSEDTSSINLWGWSHVVSPELFIAIDIPPDGFKEWSRKYRVYQWA